MMPNYANCKWSGAQGYAMCISVYNNRNCKKFCEVKDERETD